MSWLKHAFASFIPSKCDKLRASCIYNIDVIYIYRKTIHIQMNLSTMYRKAIAYICCIDTLLNPLYIQDFKTRKIINVKMSSSKIVKEEYRIK